MVNIKDRLNQMAKGKVTRRVIWFDKLGPSVQDLCLEAIELFTSNSIDVLNLADLHRFLREIIASDHPEDLATWPAENTFRRWASKTDFSKLPSRQVPSPPVNTKPQSKPKLGKDFASTLKRSTASKPPIKPSKKRA